MLPLLCLSGCAQVLGIDPTDLAPQPDPCRYLPERVYFADKPANGAAIDVGVITEAELAALGDKLGTPLSADRGHVLVRALDCMNMPAAGVQLQLRLESTPNIAEASGIVLDDAGPSLGDVSTELGLVGALNAPAENGLEPFLFPVALGDQESAIGGVVTRPKALAYIELPPNSIVDASPPPTEPPWTCVGTIAAPMEQGPAIVTLSVTVRAAPGLVPTSQPVAGVTVHACPDTITPCETSSIRDTAISDANGSVSLAVESDTGLFDGYLLVEGSAPGCGG